MNIDIASSAIVRSPTDCKFKSENKAGRKIIQHISFLWNKKFGYGQRTRSQI